MFSGYILVIIDLITFPIFLKTVILYDQKHPRRVFRCAPQVLESRLRSGIGRESNCTAGIGFRGKGGSFLS